MTGPSIEDLLATCGFGSLRADSPADAIESPLGIFQRVWLDEDSPVRREILCAAAVDLLKNAGVSRPSALVKAAIESAAESRDETADGHVGTLPRGVVDVVTEGGNLLFAGVQDGRVEFAQDWDDTSTSRWPMGAIPWSPIPTKAAVVAALRDDAGPPWDEWVQLLLERVVLPEPQRAHAALLAAWGFGTYLLDLFAYFPLLLFEGPPARGKTRLGKALLYPSFRGIMDSLGFLAAQIALAARGWEGLTRLRNCQVGEKSVHRRHHRFGLTHQEFLDELPVRQELHRVDFFRGSGQWRGRAQPHS